MNSDDPWANVGQLASFSFQSGLHIHDSQFTVTNGPVVSADGEYLFMNDTLQGIIYQYRISMNGEKLSQRKVFAQFESKWGYPDGMCFDTNGNLWVALWGGASIVQLNPLGRVLRQIPIPTKNVTNLCFCGHDLDRLIVSSAVIDMNHAEHLQYPLAGGLFEIFNHGCTGLPTHYVNMVYP